MSKLLHQELSFALNGAAMEVHRQLGPGFLEAVYQTALAHELSLRAIQFKQLIPLTVTYKGTIVGNYEADFIVEDKVVLELKATSTFHNRHTAQAINYLTTTGLELAILYNFGSDSLQKKRVVRSRQQFPR